MYNSMLHTSLKYYAILETQGTITVVVVLHTLDWLEYWTKDAWPHGGEEKTARMVGRQKIKPY